MSQQPSQRKSSPLGGTDATPIDPEKARRWWSIKNLVLNYCMRIDVATKIVNGKHKIKVDFAEAKVWNPQIRFEQFN